jgi:hypothetical protein
MSPGGTAASSPVPIIGPASWPAPPDEDEQAVTATTSDMYLWNALDRIAPLIRKLGSWKGAWFGEPSLAFSSATSSVVFVPDAGMPVGLLEHRTV